LRVGLKSGEPGREGCFDGIEPVEDVVGEAVLA